MAVITSEQRADELQARRELSELMEDTEVKKQSDLDQNLSVAERMMRRAKSNTFTLEFKDEKYGDSIGIEFRVLYSKERRRILEIINGVQNIDPVKDIEKLNDKLDEFLEIIKAVTVTEGMDAYYDSVCQDSDIIEIASGLLTHSVALLEDARRFRQ